MDTTEISPEVQLSMRIRDAIEEARSVVDKGAIIQTLANYIKGVAEPEFPEYPLS